MIILIKEKYYKQNKKIILYFLDEKFIIKSF
jgi:hypothetical protein